MIDVNLNETVSNRRVLVRFPLLTLLCAILSVAVSDLAVPFAAAFFALTLLVDRTSKKWVSLLVAVLILVCTSIVRISYVACGIAILLVGALLWFFYTRGVSKAESVLYLLLVFLSFLLLSVYLDVALEIGSFSVKDVVHSVEGVFEAAKIDFLDRMKQMIASQNPPLENSDELLRSVELMYLAVYNLLLALFAILAFFYTGIAVKLFSGYAVKLLKTPRPSKDWYFLPPVVFAYFYVALFIFSFLFSAFDSVLSIAMMNLYYVLLVVFAYLGLKHASIFLRRAQNPATARLIFILLLVFGNVLAVQILSVSGVMFVIFNSKKPTAPMGDGGDGPIDPQL